MEKIFKREILYLLTIFFSIIIILHNIIKNNGKEIIAIFFGAFLGIISFEITFNFVLSLTGAKKNLKLKIAFFLFFLIIISILIIILSNSIIYTILGYTTFVLSLLIMIFKEILNA